MSNHRFVRTLGDPYFTFQSADGIGDLNSLPGGGLTWLGMRVRIDEVPPQSASADELHPLVSFAHSSGAVIAPVLELGITPSGRFKAVAKNGDAVQTSQGLIFGASRWYDVFVNYDYLGATFALSGDVGGTVAATLGAPLLPTAGYNSRILICNGQLGLTRGRASLARAYFEFQGFGPVVYSYRFDRPNATQTPTRDTGGIFADWQGVAPLVQDDPLAIAALPAAGDVTAGVLIAIVQPWGLPPTETPVYEWGLETDFTRLPQKVTRFTRIAA